MGTCAVKQRPYSAQLDKRTSRSTKGSDKLSQSASRKSTPGIMLTRQIEEIDIKCQQALEVSLCYKPQNTLLSTKYTPIESSPQFQKIDRAFKKQNLLHTSTQRNFTQLLFSFDISKIGAFDVFVRFQYLFQNYARVRPIYEILSGESEFSVIVQKSKAKKLTKNMTNTKQLDKLNMLKQCLQIIEHFQKNGKFISMQLKDFRHINGYVYLHKIGSIIQRLSQNIENISQCHQNIIELIDAFFDPQEQEKLKDFMNSVNTKQPIQELINHELFQIEKVNLELITQSISTIQNLSLSYIQQCVLLFIAKNIEQVNYSQLFSIFQAYDTRKKSSLNKNNLEQLLRDMNKYTPLSLNYLFKVFHMEQENEISFNQFVLLTLDYDSIYSIDNIETAYKLLQNRYKLISLKQLQYFFNVDKEILQAEILKLNPGSAYMNIHWKHFTELFISMNQ